MSADAWQRIEGGLVFAVMIAALVALGVPAPWWLVLLLFFVPDISFLAYVAGPRLGAAVYNFLHLYGLGAAILAVGTFAAMPMVITAGLLWVAHVGFDRLLGYGLKEPTGFKDTHLGRL